MILLGPPGPFWVKSFTGVNPRDESPCCLTMFSDLIAAVITMSKDKINKKSQFGVQF